MEFKSIDEMIAHYGGFKRMPGNTCDLADKLLDTARYPISANFKRFGIPKDGSFEGFVQTIRCYRDNSKVRQMSQTSGDGKVLVVDAAADLSHAVLGDRLAQNFLDNNWSGIIINGAIRDSREINSMNIPILALGTVPRRTVKNDSGVVGCSLDILGTRIEPGIISSPMKMEL